MYFSFISSLCEYKDRDHQIDFSGEYPPGSSTKLTREEFPSFRRGNPRLAGHFSTNFGGDRPRVRCNCLWHFRLH